MNEVNLAVQDLDRESKRFYSNGRSKYQNKMNACGVQKLRFHFTTQHDKDAQYFHVPIKDRFPTHLKLCQR
jgi:hypothetical protein